MRSTLSISLYVLAFLLGVLATIKFYPKPQPEIITRVEYRESEIQERTIEKVKIVKPDGTTIEANIENFFSHREKLFKKLEENKTYPSLIIAGHVVNPIDRIEPIWGMSVGGRISDDYSYLAGTIWPKEKMIGISYIHLF